MRNELRHTVVACALAILCSSGSTSAQAPAPAAQGGAAPAPNANIVVEKPTYISIPLEIAVNRPVAEVWKRIGKYCDIAEWFQIAAGCTILSGKDGEVGSQRSVAAEVLV